MDNNKEISVNAEIAEKRTRQRWKYICIILAFMMPISLYFVVVTDCIPGFFQSASISVNYFFGRLYIAFAVIVTGFVWIGFLVPPYIACCVYILYFFLWIGVFRIGNTAYKKFGIYGYIIAFISLPMLCFFFMFFFIFSVKFMELFF